MVRLNTFFDTSKYLFNFILVCQKGFHLPLFVPVCELIRIESLGSSAPFSRKVESLSQTSTQVEKDSIAHIHSHLLTQINITHVLVFYK